MKRLHVSFSVTDLEQSVGFYAALFGAPPTVKKDDYAKWMLDDPRVNFVIEARSEKSEPGFSHLGIQTEDGDELTGLRANVEKAQGPVFHVGDVQCCYAKSEKTWTRDPDGVPWEMFLTHEVVDDFGVSDFVLWDEAIADGKAEAAPAEAGPKSCC